jgi:5'-nucleotidase/UDP-sugar diphosphatase
MIDQLRTNLAGENVLVLDACDQYQGLLMYTTYKGDAEIEFMNSMMETRAWPSLPMV